jgi:hypothetical protein
MEKGVHDEHERNSLSFITKYKSYVQATDDDDDDNCYYYY